jgi:hypothetical protein
MKKKGEKETLTLEENQRIESGRNAAVFSEKRDS